MSQAPLLALTCPALVLSCLIMPIRRKTRARLARTIILVSFIVATAGLLSCVRGRDRGPEQALLTFAAAGELRPLSGERALPPGLADGGLARALPALSGRDLVMFDLAGALAEDCEPASRPSPIRWAPEVLDDLRAANLKIVNLADDHALDCGPAALSIGIERLLANGFYVTGAGRDPVEARSPVYLAVGGVSVSIMSFLMQQASVAPPCDDCPGPAAYERQAMIAGLQEMKRRAAFRLVVFHRPEEQGPRLDEKTMAAVTTAIDYGADLVLCYGPASAGGLERVRGRWAVGGMGRLSGPSGNSGRLDGLVLSAEFGDSRMMNLRLAPVKIENGVPRQLRGEPGRLALRGLLDSAGGNAADNSSLVGDILYLK